LVEANAAGNDLDATPITVLGHPLAIQIAVKAFARRGLSIARRHLSRAASNDVP
jgi:hypothetical protein